MAREAVENELWEIVRLLLPPPSAHKTPAGRKRLDERRPRDWQQAGVWDRLHASCWRHYAMPATSTSSG
ncbi:hypothetical protein [Noviherbaspirillum sedimenti]|uniref:hypothetical protein n=1 Tax=Noviherbaspirillum sedimenti TaxID=2320865 RepID=UPI0011C45985|nr:hypothetical protein [Noviherbaspirillum sedimenti]